MDHIGPNLRCHLGEALGGQAHLADQANARLASRAMEVPTIHCVDDSRARTLLRRCEVVGVPAELALLTQDRQRAERIAAVQGRRVVQDVQDAHGDQATAVAGTAAAALTPAVASMTLRRNASNISSVQSGEL